MELLGDLGVYVDVTLGVGDASPLALTLGGTGESVGDIDRIQSTAGDVDIRYNGAIQVLPDAAHTVVFQRSANWIVPRNDREFTESERRRFVRHPVLERLYRWQIYWRLEFNFLAMRRLAQSAQLRRSYGDAAREFQRAEFSRAAMLRRYEELYRDGLARAAAA